MATESAAAISGESCNKIQAEFPASYLGAYTTAPQFLVNIWDYRESAYNFKSFPSSRFECQVFRSCTREARRTQLRLQKSYQFQVQKTNPKTSLLYLLVLIMTTFPFLLCWCKRSRVSKACNRGASRLGEAWARPRLGRKTYWHKDKARLMGTRNYIILLLKSQQGWTWSSWCLCCLARILSCSWHKGTASRQASRLQGYGNCSKPKKL